MGLHGNGREPVVRGITAATFRVAELPTPHLKRLVPCIRLHNSQPNRRQNVSMTDRRGEVRKVLFDAMADAPGTSRDLATRTQCGFTVAMWTLRNMVTAGEVEKLQPVRVPGVKRPVPVYGICTRDRGSQPGSDLQAVLRTWW